MSDRSRRIRQTRRAAMAAAIPSLIGLSHLPAMGKTWDGGGGANTNWSNASNWDGSPELVPGSSETVQFAAGGSKATLDTDRSCFRLDFIGAPVGGSFLLESTGSSALTVTAANIRVTAASGDFVVTAPIKLSSSNNVMNIWSATEDASGASLTFSGAISDAGAIPQTLAIGGVIGLVTLAGANTHSGGTAINNMAAVKLVSANVSSSATGSGAASLNGGTLLTGALGRIADNLFVTTAANSIVPGDAGSFGTLSVGGTMTLRSSSTLAFDVSSGNSDLIDVTTLAFAGAGQATIAITASNLAAGEYELITFDSTALVNASSFKLAAGSPSTYSLQLDSTAGQLNLIVAPEPSVALLGAGLAFAFGCSRRARGALDPHR